MQRPHTAGDAKEQEECAEGEDGEDDGAGVRGRIDEGAHRASRLACGHAEHAFTRGLSADGTRSRCGEDPAAAPASAATAEDAFARAVVRDSV